MNLTVVLKGRINNRSDEFNNDGEVLSIQYTKMLVIDETSNY